MTNALTITDLSLQYAKAEAPSICDLSFTLGASEILSVVGKSGSGKSSLLRAISGLERPQKGSISLGDRILSDASHFIRPDQRHIGLVSQNGDLFPHLTVARNIAYGLKSWSRAEKKSRIEELLAIIDLSGFEKRYPHELSGGEAQRIALARALAPRPSLILLDEPFSNLDRGLREKLRRLTVQFLHQEKTPALFVTHHPEDALAVGDRVAVMDHGKLIQLDSPERIWQEPTSSAVASLFGSINHLPETLPAESPDWIRAQDLTLCSPDQCCVQGTVTHVEYLGFHQYIFVTIDESSHVLRVEIRSTETVQLGSKVGISW